MNNLDLKQRKYNKAPPHFCANLAFSRASWGALQHLLLSVSQKPMTSILSGRSDAPELPAPLFVCESPVSAFARVSQSGNDCLVRLSPYWCVCVPYFSLSYERESHWSHWDCCVCTGQQVGKFSWTSAALRALPPPLAPLCLLLMRGLPTQTYSTPEGEHMLETSQRESKRAPRPDFLSLVGLLFFCSSVHFGSDPELAQRGWESTCMQPWLGGLLSWAFSSPFISTATSLSGQPWTPAMTRRGPRAAACPSSRTSPSIAPWWHRTCVAPHLRNTACRRGQRAPATSATQRTQSGATTPPSWQTSTGTRRALGGRANPCILASSTRILSTSPCTWVRVQPDRTSAPLKLRTLVILRAKFSSHVLCIYCIQE